jgi:hypothetical protein
MQKKKFEAFNIKRLNVTAHVAHVTGPGLIKWRRFSVRA